MAPQGDVGEHQVLHQLVKGHQGQGENGVGHGCSSAVRYLVPGGRGPGTWVQMEAAASADTILAQFPGGAKACPPGIFHKLRPLDGCS